MTLLLGILGASLLGSVHCAAMCGGFVCLYAGPVGRARARALGDHLSYNAGRLFSYVVLGVAAGAIGARIDGAARMRGLERGAAVVAGTLMVAWAAAVIANAAGVHVARVGSFTWLRRRFGSLLLALQDQPPVVRAGATGMLTTLLPCGWLYTFVVAAGGTGSPLTGAAVMLAFWAGTLPMMLGVGLGMQRVSRRIARHLPVASAAFVLVLGMLSIAGRLRPLALTSGHVHTMHAGR